MISRETIISPVTKIDEVATKEARERAANAVEPQYHKDEKITENQIKLIDNIFADARRNIADKSLKEEEKIANLKDAISKDLSQEFYLKLVRIPPEELQSLRLETRNIVNEILADGIKQENLADKRDLVDRRLTLSSLSSNARFIVRELARKCIIVNEVYDEKKTEKMREVARDEQEVVQIRKGQILVSVGEEITKDQYRKLQVLGLIKQKNNPWPYLGLALIIGLMITLLYFYIRRFHSYMHQDPAKLLMFVLVLLLTLLSMKVLAIGQDLKWSTLGYLAPVAFGTMLSTLLLNVELAFGGAFILGVAASILFNNENHMLFDFRFALVAFISGATSAFSLAGVKRRSSILQAGLIASLTSVVPILAFFCLNPSEMDWRILLMSLGFGITNGLFSAVLTIGFLPIFESLFGILSPLRLLELANPNHPLLRKLLIETPGTYHHSIIVGNLSESAAEAIGADGLLARVGAYYHDVGKIKRPQFFIENQINRQNPHDKISPNLSKTIIVSHARDGVEMLKQHKIPKPIQDIAAQHHGTTLIKYFYHKAQKESHGTQVLEEDYRYPGPKAQFKEAAIVGICDCVEAAVRSLARPTPARIENLVRKIIHDRLDDGQFDECHLTLKELDLIARSVCETLQGIFHSRIEYPEEVTVVKGVKHG
ncbi:HD family phosphohydrolase [Thermoflavimicrobium daqui]|nr:HD family phosphohydrolase [Thermoflavimicrobium daqui]